MSNRIIKLSIKGIDEFVNHLKGVSFRQTQNGVSSIARQIANDVAVLYKSGTPIGPDENIVGGKRRNKYGQPAGNLRKSIRVFRKRIRNVLVIEYSIGPKTHRYGELQAKLGKKTKSGKPVKITDGYYGFMVNEGVAGRSGKSIKSKGFIDKMKPQINKIIDGPLSDRVVEFTRKKMQDIVNKKSKG